MIERKKEYILDALGELEDGFIAETIEYEKRRFSWRYNRELATVAACIAVVFLSVTAYRMLPIGVATDNATGALEREEIALEGADVEMPDSVQTEGALETMPEIGTITGANKTTDEYKEDINKVVESVEKIYRSKGIEWEEITAAKGAEKAEKDSSELPMLESMQTSSCVQWLSPEEIFAMDIDIFMGTVTDMQAYHVTGGMNRYFTVVTVEVEDSIRSELGIGDTCRVYLPFAEVDGITATTSIIGDLGKLEVGSRAIFMPHQATEDVGLGNGDVWLSYADFADYYFGEGMRFLFLETPNGTSYETGVYEVTGGSAASLEDIAEYIRGMLND